MPKACHSLLNPTALGRVADKSQNTSDLFKNLPGTVANQARDLMFRTPFLWAAHFKNTITKYFSQDPPALTFYLTCLWTFYLAFFRTLLDIYSDIFSHFMRRSSCHMFWQAMGLAINNKSNACQDIYIYNYMHTHTLMHIFWHWIWYTFPYSS